MSAWNNIVGHEWAIEVLSAAIEHDRVGHAYLITGPQQVGKTTLAKTFAQALNCLSAENRPCGQCRSCQLIASDRHPDVSHTEPELNARGNGAIKIETIRNLQRALNLAAIEGPYRIAILSDFDAANSNAANAFLKTLEEPPANTVLILTATDGDNLLETIKSRCRVISIRPIATADISFALQERWSVEADQALTLAHMANGRIGWALSALEDNQIYTQYEAQLETLQQVLQASLVERFKLAERLAKKPEDLAFLLNVWLTWWRDLLLVASQGDGGAIINIGWQSQFEQLAASWSHASILCALERTAATLQMFNFNVNFRLALENLFLDYPLSAEFEIVQEIASKL